MPLPIPVEIDGASSLPSGSAGMKKIVHRFIADESGTGVVEADFVILVVAVVLMSAMANPGLGHAHAFSSAASAP